MPAAQFNVGRDSSIATFTTDGGILSGCILTEFMSKPITTEIKVIGLDGVLRPAYLPEGWEGSFEYTRSDATFDDYFANLEANYYGGADLPSGTITQTIEEVDGTISQYRYTGLALKMDDAGSWKGNAEVRQKIAFCASRRLKVL